MESYRGKLLNFWAVKNKNYRQIALDEWAFWRPILEKVASYTEMSEMSVDDALTLNAALDILNEKKNEEMR